MGVAGCDRRKSQGAILGFKRFRERFLRDERDLRGRRDGSAAIAQGSPRALQRFPEVACFSSTTAPTICGIIRVVVTIGEE